MKRWYSLLLTLGLLLLLPVSASGADRRDPAVTLDGVPLDLQGTYISQEGVTMVPLRALAEALGLQVRWDGTSRTVSLLSGGALPPAQAESPEERPLVVLDPGHGGSAAGARYEGVEEKVLNLSIALQAAALLEEADIQVILTRSVDQDVDLYDRTSMANGQKADLFVSVHCNASLTNSQARGIYTAAAEEDTPGWQLAQCLRLKMMEAAQAADMGTEARPNLAVLRTAQMPAALVECGYMSTPEELAQLVRPEYQAKLAQGIAGGVLEYLGN